MTADIEQLAKQAGLSTQYIEYFGPKLLEQFAKVIAEECAKCCDNYSADVLKFSQFGSNAAKDCAGAIKDHFGVNNV